jgi:hypothetical protein
MPRIDVEPFRQAVDIRLLVAEMLSIFEREREIGLCSTRFLEGVRNHGGVGYAHRLLQKADSDLPKDTFSFPPEDWQARPDSGILGRARSLPSVVQRPRA